MFGLSKQGVCEIESGNRRPTRPTLLLLCDNLSLPSDEKKMVFRHFGHVPETKFDRLGLHLRSLRLEAGIPQLDLANGIGSTRAAVSRAESGGPQALWLSDAIYDFFEVPQQERISNEDNQHPQPQDVLHPESEGKPAHCQD